jgi:hypothetical protein
MMRVLLVSAAILVCAWAATADAHGGRQGAISRGTHKGVLHGGRHREAAERRRPRKSPRENSPVCRPAYDLVFHRIVCLDPRYIY